VSDRSEIIDAMERVYNDTSHPVSDRANAAAVIDHVDRLLEQAQHEPFRCNQALPREAV
jgi:hypothetical protein